MTTTEANIETVRREFEEVWNEGNMDLVDELYSDEYVGHSTTGDIEGPEARKGYIGTFRSAFPDGRIEVEDLLASEDRVVARYSWHGTHEGELMGIEPTGNRVDVGAIAIARFEDGKIAEHWIVGDVYGLMQQLGVVPSEAATPAE